MPVPLYGGGDDLVPTNLTGHPTVVLPNGFHKAGDRKLPNAITFTGRLYGETDLLAAAHAYQQATGHHLKRPPMDKRQQTKRVPSEPKRKRGTARPRLRYGP